MRFNRRLDDTQPLQVEVSPAPPAPPTLSWDGVNIPGPLLPDTTYTVHLAAGVKATTGEVFDRAVIGHFATGPEQPALRLGKQRNSVLELSRAAELTAAVRNFGMAAVELGRLSEADIVPFLFARRKHPRAARPHAGYELSELLARVTTAGASLDLRGQRNTWERLPLDAPGLLGVGHGGVVFHEVVASEPVVGTRRDLTDRVAGLTQLTDLAVTAKRSADETVVWVTSLSTAQPVASATVRVRDRANQLLWTGATDARGLVVGPGMRELASAEEPLVATVETGADLAYLLLETEWALEPWSFGIQQRWDPLGQRYRIQLFNERGVYRPGETVHLKGIVREEQRSQWLVPAQRTATVRVEDPEYAVLLSVPAAISEFGTFDVTVELPRGAKLGHYSVSAAMGQAGDDDDERSDGRGSFRVEEFRAPDFRVATTAPVSGLAAASFTAQTRGEYLFGAPMAAARLRWSVLRAPTWFRPAGDWDGFSFVDQTADRPSRELVEEASVELDGFGASTHTVAVPGGLSMPYLYTVDAEVTDANEQVVAGSARTIVHPGDRYLGVGLQGWVVAADAPVTVQLVAVELDGAPASGVKAELVVSRREWSSALERSTAGEYVYRSEPLDVEVGRCPLRTAATPVDCTVDLPGPGYFIARASGKDSRGVPIAASRGFYAAGKGWAPWQQRNDGHVELVADRETYEPGEVARVLVQSPFAPATALLTIERSGVLETRVETLQGNASTLEIPIDDGYIPNVFVSVVLLKGRTAEPEADGADPGKPAFVMGYVELPVAAHSRQLSVEVTPDPPIAAPGSTVTVRVDVRDVKGLGAAAEVTLFAVDEGVLGLTAYRTPDPFAYFYAKRALGVLSAETRLHLFEPEVRVSDDADGDKGDESAGDGDGDSGLRYEFVTTPLWNASLRTDAAGHATTSFQLPDNLTTFRIMAVASGPDARFGHGESAVTSTKELIVRAALPRFARLGDRFEAAVIVHDRGTEPGATVVTLEADEGAVELLGESEQTLEGEATGARRVRFEMVATGVGVATLTLRASKGTAVDAMRVELPIIFDAPQETVATTGVTEGATLQRVVLPGGVHPELGGIDVAFASTALVGLNEGVRYLLDYPYGCIEQSASRLLLMASLRPLLAEFRMLDVSPQELDAWMADLMAHMAQLQVWSGGFRMWPDSESAVTAAGTLHAVFALAVAQEQGADVPHEVMEAAKKYLRGQLKRKPKAGGHSAQSDAVAAFAVFVLARLGAFDEGYATSLFERYPELPLVARAHLALAYATSPETHATELAALVASLDATINAAPADAHVLTDAFDAGAGLEPMWSSDVRTSAWVLLALLAASPTDPFLPRLAQGLMEERRNGRWHNTQDNAVAALAMLRYLRSVERVEPNFVAQLFVDDDLVAAAPFRGRSGEVVRHHVPMSGLDLDEQVPVVVARLGTGKLYYGLRLTYSPSAAELPAREEGLGIERRYVRLADGEEVEGSLAAGEVVVVRLTVISPLRASYVVVHDPLPAGLEPVDLTFATTSPRLAFELRERKEEGALGRRSWYEAFTFDHAEKHDDAVDFFADSVSPGVYELTYLARATGPGAFAVPPAHTEEMYAPEVFGRTASRRLTVEPRQRAGAVK